MGRRDGGVEWNGMGWNGVEWSGMELDRMGLEGMEPKEDLYYLFELLNRERQLY